MSIAALVLGIIGLVLGFLIIGIIPAILGLIFSIIVLRKGKDGMAIAGLVCSIVGILLSIMVLMATPSTQTATKSGTVTKQADKTVTTETKTENIADKMDVKEYSYMSGKYRMVDFYVTNNSDQDVAINMNVTAKGSDGKAKGSSSPFAFSVAPGTSCVLPAAFENVAMDDAIDYSMDVSTKVRAKSAANDIDIEISKNENKAIIMATNNGPETAYYLNVYIIFLENGKPIYSGMTYITGDNSDIKSGETRSAEITCYEGDYDDIVFGYTAEYHD